MSIKNITVIGLGNMGTPIATLLIKVTLPMSGLYRQLMLQAFYSGLFGQDGTVVMKIYEQLAGIKRKYKDPFKR